MKQDRLTKLAAVATAVAAITSGGPLARAATATWTNGASGNAWETAGNWNPATVPNSSAFDVTIPIAAACNLSSQFQIGALDLSVATANLNLVPGATLAIAGTTFNNDGAILVNTTGANTATLLRCDGSPTITGSGSIRLNGNANFGPASGSTVTIGASQLIHGHGVMDFFSGGGHLINSGTINADDGSATLINMSLSYDAPGQTQNQNNSVIEATAGSVLLFGGIIDQTGGGSFSASGAGSIVEFGNGDQNRFSVITGGTFTTSNNGLVRTTPDGQGVTVIGSTNNGAFQVPAGNNPVIITGSGLTNNGVITVNDGTGTASGVKIRFDASGTLGGTGSLVLRGVGTSYNIADLDLHNVTVTNGANHTIRGLGTILGDGSQTFINNGTIIADDPSGGSMQLDLAGIHNINNGIIKAIGGGLLGLYSGYIDQSGGGSFIADGSGSVVTLGGSGAVVIGGTLATQNGGVIQAQGTALFLAGSLTNSGAFEMPSGTSTHVPASALTNNGTMTLKASDSLLQFDANTAITGTGAIVLTNSAVMKVYDGMAVSNDGGHAITGSGAIQIGSGATFTNNGTLSPGRAPAAQFGQINVDNSLTLGTTSNLSFEIGGTTAATQYDVLNKLGSTALTLQGSLLVRLVNGFQPSGSDVYNVVTTQVALQGSFANVTSGSRLSTADGAGSFIVTCRSRRQLQRRWPRQLQRRWRRQVQRR